MKGVTRRFWLLVSLVCLVEIGLVALAVRPVRADLSCWDSSLIRGPRLSSVCGNRIPLVGSHLWVPAALILVIVGVSVAAGLFTLCTQLVRTRRATRRFSRSLPLPEQVGRGAKRFGVTVALVDDDRVFCFCVGLVLPEVVMSSGMAEGLPEDEILAVLAHESAHAHRRDPARALAVRAAANALFFVPLARKLAGGALVAAELGADAEAVTLVGRDPLIRALLRSVGQSRPDFGSATEMASDGALEDRVQALRTARLPRMRPSVLVVGASVLVVAVLVALGAWLPGPRSEGPAVPATRVIRTNPHSVPSSLGGGPSPSGLATPG